MRATERMERVADEVLLEMAAAEGRVLVTRNVRDFLDILGRRPPEERPAGLVPIPNSVRLDDFGTFIRGIHGTVSGRSQERWTDRVAWMRKTG